jgi:hypothetical protein
MYDYLRFGAVYCLPDDIQIVIKTKIGKTPLLNIGDSVRCYNLSGVFSIVAINTLDDLDDNIYYSVQKPNCPVTHVRKETELIKCQKSFSKKPQKKLKIEFTFIDTAYKTLLLYRVLEQTGLPSKKKEGTVKIDCYPKITHTAPILNLRGQDKDFDTSSDYLVFDKPSTQPLVLINYFEKAINDELFPEVVHQIKCGEKCLVKNDDSHTWQEAVYITKHPYKLNKEGDACVVVDKKKYITVYDHCKPLSEYTVKHTRDEFENKIVLTWEKTNNG